MQSNDDSRGSIARKVSVTGCVVGAGVLAAICAVMSVMAMQSSRGRIVTWVGDKAVSAEAAREIKALIGASVDRVDSGSRLVADAGKTMQEIVGSVQRVTDIIGEITAASSEQSDGIGQVSTSVVQLDKMTQQNAALVEQSAAAAESLKEQALRLAEAVSVFTLDTPHVNPA